MSRFQMDFAEVERLQNAIKNFSGDAEKIINEVLHTEGIPLVQDSIRRLIPESTVKPWKGKAPHAKQGNSLTDEKGNLFFVVKTTKKYQYLYFPDDGTNTRRHIGNQEFFRRGGESQQSEIVDRCIKRLADGFENL